MYANLGGRGKEAFWFKPCREPPSRPGKIDHSSFAWVPLKHTGAEADQYEK
jgi:hypothetical protein